jgi:predicted nucleic acid-binding protein
VTTYLLDANVFIQAKNLHYGLDFCPAFWRWLAEKNTAGQVFSIDKVADEIAAGEDELVDWMRQNASIFRETDATTVARFGEVSAWVMGQNYEPAAINAFLQVADFYLIAHALAEGYVVVTHEAPANSVRRIKIPNVCAGLNLRFMTPYEMLRRERARFVLGQT